MNVSGAWTSQEIIKIVVCTVSIVGGALFVACRSNRKHRQMIEAFAQKMGWSLIGDDTGTIKTALEALFPEDRFTLTKIMEVETGSRHILLADGVYSHNTGDRGVHLTGVCLIESTRFCAIGARVEVNPYWWIDAKLLSDQVRMEDGDFARAFIVQSTDLASVYRILNPSIQEALLEHTQKPSYTPVQVVFNSNCMALRVGYIAQPEGWLDLVELAQKIESVAQ